MSSSSGAPRPAATDASADPGPRTPAPPQGGAPATPPPSPLLRPLKTHHTPWQPSSVKVTLNLVLDGCIVPTSGGGARVDYAHLVVLDNFLDEPTRSGLMAFLTHQPSSGCCPANNSSSGSGGGGGPPGGRWERATADAAHRPATWGLRPEALRQFAQQDLPAKLEVQSRLAKLYPDCLIAHMPSEHIQLGLQQQQEHQQQQQQDQQEHHHQQQQHQQQAPAVDCSCFLANAAVYGDQFSWHVDADPQSFPEPTAWSEQYDLYCNREPGKPLFVSLLLYLDDEWPRDHDAETLFLDSMTDTGVFVRPKRYRAVLMDQDVTHRLSTPSAAAGRPRYSLVWKLVMLPRAMITPPTLTSAPPPPQGQQQQQHQGQQQQQQQAQPRAPVASLARPEWGRPTYFGSAAHVERMARQAAAATAAGSSAPPPATAAR